jgi:hypothetical protein
LKCTNAGATRINDNRKFEGHMCDSIKTCGGGRPHVIYNQKTKKYVLWTDYGFPGYQVSTADSMTGPFVKTKIAALDPSHGNLKPGDFALEEFSK